MDGCSTARRRSRLRWSYRLGVPGDDDAPDLARELELRDELLMACREVLLSMGSARAAGLVAHINAVLDLDDGFSPPRGTPT